MLTSSLRRSVLNACCLMSAALWLAGCGQSDAPHERTLTTSPTEPSTATPGSKAPGGPITANLDLSESNDSSTTMASADAAEPEPGTPEWALREIMRIRLLPLPSLDPEMPKASDDDDEGVVGASATSEDTAAQFQQLVAQTRAIRRERNQEIVKLAMDALALSVKDPEKEDVFNAAVHHMLDAHLQLALQGDEDSIAALYEAAEAFHNRRPDSPAAAQAQFTLVNLAHANALRYAKSEPSWLTEFARHAQLFATRFPDDADQGLPLLLAAGRSCEVHGLLEDAKSCFSLIQSKYPDSPQATQVAGIARRLNLVGKSIEFGGPTIDGNFVTLEDYADKTVVAIFWATHAKPFVDSVTELQAISDKYKKYAQVLSVNLDSEDIVIDNFVEKTNLTWPVIFHVEHDKRGWNSPLAAHYGVTSLPTIWIIDPKGVVAATDVTPETLEAKLRDVILQHRTAGGGNTGENPNRP